ncbi:predicted protein [Arabidopsis lyrata subsp. lyrata]|uniref:Predicted protein n=1 Tax=Arabidopsis lyrata subsp. lyrata TaxID=81972 RepID=D7KYQ5_ARALL|nr:predicted protein [Arabidopsis lyrata subsp. lyrata]
MEHIFFANLDMMHDKNSSLERGKWVLTLVILRLDRAAFYVLWSLKGLQEVFINIKRRSTHLDLVPQKNNALVGAHIVQPMKKALSH